jgi:multimeric flavodoxin WrbA
MRRILGVVGSPRKNGNTHVLVSALLEAACEAGATAETLLLGELTIRECDGCHACWSDKPCTKDDDMNGVYPTIIDSDVIVFGTPVYWYAPTALMKAFVDRLVYFNCPENRPKILGKSAVIVVPFEEDDPQTASLVVAFFERCLDYLQMDLVGKIIVPGVTRRGEVRDRADRIEEARNLGQRLATDASTDT